jgi:hypothetical protein
MKAPKVQATNKYDLFYRSDDNRPLDLTRHKALSKSMETYGFLEDYPIGVYPDGKGKFVIKDGQHRHAIAASLGLPIYYIISSVDYDVAVVSSAAKGWRPIDYAERWAAAGKPDYTEAIEFVREYKIPLCTGFALLAGTTSFGNLQPAFTNGDYKVKDRAWAVKVASLHQGVSRINPKLRSANLLIAFMAVCRLPEFDSQRLLANAASAPDKLVGYSTLDQCLRMLEEVYNFRRTNRFPLEFKAREVMRARSAAKPKRDDPPA